MNNSQAYKGPAAALKHATELRPNDEFGIIQLNGSLVTQTYAQIWENAKKKLRGLRSLGLQSGNTIIFHLDATSQDFAPALWSCIMGGFVPVPVPLASDYSQPNPSLSTLYNITQQLDSPIILTATKNVPQINAGLTLYSAKNVKTLTIEEIETHSPDTRLHQLHADELALLLPSSGTTGKTKLIEVNGRTFIYRFLKNALNEDKGCSGRVFLSWFPLESVGGILTATPNSFRKSICIPMKLLISNPLLWLDSISRYQVTHAQTSNFILSLIIEQLRTNPHGAWDLSCIQKIGIGAEPIIAKTVRDFVQMLNPYNLQPKVMHPAYGMSECGPIAGKPAYAIAKYNPITDSQEGFSLPSLYDVSRLVEIGEPAEDHSIRIVDHQGCILEEGLIGLIQVTGPSMTSGYYKAPELTRELFTEDGWINTGDLGFIKHGKLTVTGREKEIVIINARNLFCQEIELVVEEVEGVEPAYTVACGIRQQDSVTDELAIFFHPLITEESQLAKLVLQVRGKVTQTLGINPAYMIPIEKTVIPRTPTGKIQRFQLKQSLETGEFDAIIKRVDKLIKQESEGSFAPPRNKLESELTKIWRDVIGIDMIGIHDNFFDLGGHSLLAAQVLHRINQMFDADLPLRTLFDAPTVAELRDRLTTFSTASQILVPKTTDPSLQSLVPIQPTGSQPPIFAIHILGKGLEFYRPMARELGHDYALWGLSYDLAAPASQCGIAIPTSIPELATHYIEEMRTLQPQGPYSLLGFSNGGLVAYEMAKQLEQQGHANTWLILFDTSHPITWKSQTEVKTTRSLITRACYQLAILLVDLHMLEKHERWPWAKKRLAYYAGKIYARIAPRSMSKQQHSVSPDFYNSKPSYFGRAFFLNYFPSGYQGRIILFKARYRDWSILSKDKGCRSDALGWETVSSKGVETYAINGDHVTILTGPGSRVIAKHLMTILDRRL